MGKGLVSSIALGFGIAACSAPVLRPSEGAPGTSGFTDASLPVPAPTTAMPDLKKRVWILAPEVPSVLGRELANVPVDTLLRKEVNDVFGAPTSPYVPEETSTDTDLDSEKIARIARGAGISGFLKPRITRFELVRRKNPEGLLQSTTVELVLTVALDLHDAGSAKKVLTVEQSDSIVETRSLALSTEDEPMPEIDRKLAQMSHRIAERLLAKSLPIVEKLGWSGRVVRLDGARVYINAGSRTGLRAGDLLKVVEAPREIVDPQTGVGLGLAPGRLKATLKVIQLFGSDGSVSAIQSGGGVLPGDRVELY